MLGLNRNWQPVHVANVARSLMLLWNETAGMVVAGLASAGP
jgi:hypothetical protein